MFMPETKIKASQTIESNRVCPISGWYTSNIIKGSMNKVLKKYLKYNLLFLIVSINDNATIKKGLTISTGWNLGKNIKSNHLFDPFTSIPINGTNNKLKKFYT